MRSACYLLAVGNWWYLVVPAADTLLLNVHSRVMFVGLSSINNNPFRHQLDALQADAMGVGDLPPGLYF